MMHAFITRRHPAALGLALILAAVAWALPAPARADLEGGAPAPNFELASIDRSKPLVMDKVQGYRLLARAVLANLEGRPTTLRWQAGTTGTLSSPLLRDR